jgi:hypothetical protein
LFFQSFDLAISLSKSFGSTFPDKMPDLSGVAAAAAAGARGLISNYAPSRASEWADAERSCSQIQYVMNFIPFLDQTCLFWNTPWCVFAG